MNTQAEQTNSSQGRLHWLDWFRFAAAFDVMAAHMRSYNWVHYDQMSGKSWLAWTFFLVTHWGGEAVILFFVLSGFLVGGKILERSIDGSFDLRAYVLDRVTRIYVPLIPALLISGIVCLVIGGQPVSLLSFLGNLAGLQTICVHSYGGNLPLWTISYEIWFYVLGGLFAVLISGGNRTKAISLFGIMFVMILFTRMDAALLFCWCLGACGYLLVSADISALVFCGAVALTVFGLAFSEYISAHRNSFGNFFSSGRVAQLIFSFGLAIVFAFVSKRAPVSRPILAFEKLGGKLAAFSYTLYLTHLPMRLLWEKFRMTKYTTFELHSMSWFVIEIGSCLLFAFVFYLPFEAQTSKVRIWLKRNFPGTAVPESSRACDLANQ